MIVAKKYAIWCRVILLYVCDIINDKILFIISLKLLISIRIWGMVNKVDPGLECGFILTRFGLFYLISVIFSSKMAG